MSHNKQSGGAHQQHTPQTGQEHGHVHQTQDREIHAHTQLGQEQHQIGHLKPHDPHDHSQDHSHNHAKTSEKSGITIYMNRTPHHLPADTFTAADLRKLAVPPIGADTPIFRVVPGKNADIQLNDSDVIVVNMHVATQGRHFYSDKTGPSHEAVASRAYTNFLEEGSHHGNDAENWLRAESELKHRPIK